MAETRLRGVPFTRARPPKADAAKPTLVHLGSWTFGGKGILHPGAPLFEEFDDVRCRPSRMNEARCHCVDGCRPSIDVDCKLHFASGNAPYLGQGTARLSERQERIDQLPWLAFKGQVQLPWQAGAHSPPRSLRPSSIMSASRISKPSSFSECMMTCLIVVRRCAERTLSSV